MSTPEKTTLFLKEFKVRMEKRDGFMFYKFRGVNRDTLSYLGIQISHVKEIISALTFEDYSEGPVVSENPKLGNLWIFGAIYNGCELYIKLSDKFSFDKATCVSFHFPTQRMPFPFKTLKKKEKT